VNCGNLEHQSTEPLLIRRRKPAGANLTGPRIARHARRDGGQDRAAAGHQRGRLSCGMHSADRQQGCEAGVEHSTTREESADDRSVLQ
jgi:hypothetical protein